MRKPSRFKIGLLFLLGLTFSAGVLIWIGAANFFRHSKSYVSYFDSSVQGLSPGAEVSYRGIQVGQVRSKELAPDGRLVEVRIELDPGFEVRKGQAVSVAQQGLTGSHYLALGKPPSGVHLVQPPFGFDVEKPVIPSYQGGRQRMLAAIADLSDRLGSLPLDKLVKRWAGAGEELRETLGSTEIDRTLENLRRASADAEAVLDTLSRPGTRRDMRQGLSDLSASAESIRKASGDLAQQLDALPPEAVANLTGKLGDTVGSLQVAVRRLERLLPRMDDLVRTLREHPGQITVRQKSQEPFDQ